MVTSRPTVPAPDLPDRESLRDGYGCTVPDRILRDHRTLAALAAGDWAVLSIVNRRQPMTQIDLGRYTGLTSNRIGDYIHGRVRPRHRVVLERISDGLGIPGGLMGLPTRPWEKGTPSPVLTPVQVFGGLGDQGSPDRLRRAGTTGGGKVGGSPHPWGPTTVAGTVEVLTALTSEGPMQRREFLTLTGAAVVIPGYQWLLDAERVTAVSNGLPVDAATMDGIEQIVNFHRAMADRVGIHAALPPLQGQLTGIVELIKRNSYSEDVGMRLYAAASELARMIACLHFVGVA